MLANEFLCELYTDSGRYEEAQHHIRVALTKATESMPESDAMTEVLRRAAQLDLDQAEHVRALNSARRCIQLSRRIGDRYELGAATRVLGEVYAAQGNVKRAAACFRAAVNGLKSIHECYELMRSALRTGCFSLASRQARRRRSVAPRSTSAREELELDYYQALIAVALVDTLAPQERLTEASTWLARSDRHFATTSEGIDLRARRRAVKRSATTSSRSITRASVREAETLKTICRVYEDARFPIVEMKPDLAYQIAQSVGAECLFVIATQGRWLKVCRSRTTSVLGKRRNSFSNTRN